MNGLDAADARRRLAAHRGHIPERWREQAAYNRQVKADVQGRGKVLPDSIDAPDILIGRTLSSRAYRDTLRLPDGSRTAVTEGTRITGVKVIAGKGVGRKIDDIEKLLHYGGSKKDWQKKRGNGYVDDLGISRPCELHWYEEPVVGRVEMKVKRFYY